MVQQLPHAAGPNLAPPAARGDEEPHALAHRLLSLGSNDSRLGGKLRATATVQQRGDCSGQVATSGLSEETCM